MSYYEGSNWQAKKEDEGKPLYSNMEKKYPVESDARPAPPSFDEMVELIKKLFTDYLEDIVRPKMFTDNEIEKSWERYKTLNHLYQDEEALTVKDYEAVLADQRRLVRELDVIVNGTNAAKQASLVDMVCQIRDLWPPQRIGWVKASERLPENRKWNYIFRQANNTRSATVIYLDHVADIADYMKLPIDNIEWLDESQPQPGKEVAFAQWLADQGWKPRIKDEWARYVTLYSDISIKTTAELFEKFKKINP